MVVCEHPVVNIATVKGPSLEDLRVGTFSPPSESLMQPAARRVRRASAGRNISFLLRQERVTAANVEAAQPFTWARCFVSLFSYALLLSDVVRSGFGIQTSTLRQFPQPGPDRILHFGPYAYRILHLPVANVSMPDTSTISTWAYKFDTTSVGMRSIAQQLGAPHWQPCLFYHGPCESYLPARTAFGMLDALIDAVSMHPHSGTAQGHITVRSEYDWVDRIHHFALPWFFQRTVKRTTQATHYRVDPREAPLSICGRSTGLRPYACDDAWTKYRRFCDPSANPYCADVTETIWSHIESRMANLLVLYANHTVEFALIEGADDHTRPGLTFQGRKLVDVVTLARVMDCRSSMNACKTVAVDDYRYEAASMTINAADWFGIIALIRGVGQGYAWLRLASLGVGTYCALRASEGDKSSRWGLLTATLRTMFIIPSQVVIYGSVFPILCYVAAHLIDSCAVYEFVALHFNSTFGYFHFDLQTFVNLSAVSTRSLWLLALVCHIIVAAYSRRSWSPTYGVPGIPEFSISFVASLTIFAQIRSTSWRSTRIRQVYEVVRSSRRHRWQTMSYGVPRRFVNRLFFGSTIDMQCLLASFMLLLGLLVLSWLAGVLLPRLVSHRMTLFSRSLVPYSAGLLWMTNGLVVCWNGAFLIRIPTPTEKRRTGSKTSSLIRTLPFRRVSRIHHFAWKRTNASTVELAISDTEVSVQLQRDMHSVVKRSREVEAMVFLVNLAVMTDPVTFCRLRALRGRLVGLYQSRLTSKRVLLPREAGLCEADIPLDFAELELVTMLNSKQLLWCELLLCG